MKVWLPYVEGGSGADVSTRYLAAGLEAAGRPAILQAFPHSWQYAPWPLRFAAAPPKTRIVVANSWNAFAFRRPGAKLVAVERLFVLDPALKPYRSFAQATFHEVLVRRFVAQSYQSADAVIALSADSARQMTAAFPALRPHLILNGVDTDFFTPSADPKEELAGRPVRLLFVGNLSRRKGADLLEPIMRALGPGYELSYTSGLRTKDRFAGAPGMRPLGRLDQTQIREAYRAADILLLPTRLEGLPRAVMEAMACGTPVVASRASSLPEAINHGANGWLARPDDPEDFAAGVCELSGSSVRLRAAAAAARETATSRFSLRRMIADYVRLFEALA